MHKPVLTTQPIALIAGYSDGLGEALKDCFEQAGYQVLTISRQDKTFAGDLTSAANVQPLISRIIAEHGLPEVVISNTAMFMSGAFEAMQPTVFEQVWKTNVMSTFNLAAALLPQMAERGSGSFIVTGATASLRGGKGFSAFASAKFALRGLTQSLAREYSAKGIHVAHMVLDGILWSANSRERFPDFSKDDALLPEDVAQIYVDIVRQRPTAWTHELDIRPANETF